MEIAAQKIDKELMRQVIDRSKSPKMKSMKNLPQFQINDFKVKLKKDEDGESQKSVEVISEKD